MELRRKRKKKNQETIQRSILSLRYCARPVETFHAAEKRSLNKAKQVQVQGIQAPWTFHVWVHGARTQGEDQGSDLVKAQGSKTGSEEPFMKNYGFEVFPAADGELGNTLEQQCNSALGR